MNKVISWNNKRHCITYWLSIVMMLIVELNIKNWLILDDRPILGRILDNIYEFYSQIIPSFAKKGVDYIMLTSITICIIILVFIVLINHFVGFFPDLKILKKNYKYSYLLRTVVIEDIITGIGLEIGAIKGLYVMCAPFIFGPLVILLYAIIFLYGSYLYWKSTVMIKEIYELSKKMKYEKKHDRNWWYSVCNWEERVSTFYRVPWKGKIDCFILDKEDILRCDKISEKCFYYYLFIIDCNLAYNEQFCAEIDEILSMPHANILAIVFGKSYEYLDLINELESQRNVRIVRCSAQVNSASLDIESIINNSYCYNDKVKIHPCSFISDDILMDTYLKIGGEPKICSDFLKIIMNDLDTIPAIYALFDFIDLQYRIQIACRLEGDFETQCRWMRKKGKIIGRINAMAKIIGDKVMVRTIANYSKTLSTQYLFEEIISDEDMKLIGKYLPDYRKDYIRPMQDIIVYLTAILRNAIRGHGTFEREDAMNLYAIVFKLALLNIYLLNGNNVILKNSDKRIWEEQGYYYYVKSESLKFVSPFLISDEDDNLLFFNNWNKGGKMKNEQIEYINYLNGKLVLINL